MINRYIGLVLEKQEPRHAKEDRIRASFRHGDGASEILSVQLLNARGEDGGLDRQRRGGHGAGAVALPSARCPTPWWGF